MYLIKFINIIIYLIKENLVLLPAIPLSFAVACALILGFFILSYYLFYILNRSQSCFACAGLILLHHGTGSWVSTMGMGNPG